MTGLLVDWAAHHAATKPDAIALRNVDTGETRSWRELDGRVGRIAHGLRHSLGLAAGDRIAILANGDLRTFELQFACIRAQIVIVPLNFRLAAAELALQCRETDAKLIFTDADWRTLADQTAELAGLARILGWIGPDSAYEQMIAQATGRIPPLDGAKEADPVYIFFTSGTTGRPKAAIYTHGMMVWQAFNQVEFARVAERGAHVFTSIPLFHAGGFATTNPILFFGGEATISARFDAAAGMRLVGDPANGITHLSLVPLMYQMMADTPEFVRADLSRMRTALVAGGRLTPSLWQVYADKGVYFMTQYGGTETGPTVTALDPGRGDKALAGSCGQKARHVAIRLVDGNGDEVAEGEAGEIWVKGPAITPGYLGRDPDLDFTDGWFRTGDIARCDDEGFYFIVDRIKEMYKTGGENVSSAEVELVLQDHPAVSEVAVIGIPDPRWGEVGLAIVVVKHEHEISLTALHEICEGRIARYKFPKRLELVDAMPRNVTGKVAKHELRQRFGGTASA